MMHGREKSDSAIRAKKPANKAGQPAAEWVEQRAEAEGNMVEPHTRRTPSRESVSQGLDRVRQAAKARKKERFTALLHHVNPDSLRQAFLARKRDAAPGVDGMTWREYEAELEPRLADLHGRIHRGAYRPRPSRRTYIPKADGRERPLAIAALEDKIVQGATVMVLNAIYEEDFPRVLVRVPTRTRTARRTRRLDGRDRQPEGELDTGRRHPVVLRHGKPGLAHPFR